jgi:hypothetical protein
MKSICPLPEHWLKILDQLRNWISNTGAQVTAPPAPLILAGWVYSNDVEKRERWLETVEWAERHGCVHLLECLTPEKMYRVDEPSNYVVGPMGGPMHLAWNHEPRPSFTDMDAEKAISVLKEQWHQIAGVRLSKVTSPIEITGLKKRRLLVQADYNHAPPWGSWTRLDKSEKRREFTRLRQAVNYAIHPLMVDHIDFLPKS